MSTQKTFRTHSECRKCISALISPSPNRKLLNHSQALNEMWERDKMFGSKKFRLKENSWNSCTSFVTKERMQILLQRIPLKLRCQWEGTLHHLICIRQLRRLDNSFVHTPPKSSSMTCLLQVPSTTGYGCNKIQINIQESQTSIANKFFQKTSHRIIKQFLLRRFRR